MNGHAQAGLPIRRNSSKGTLRPALHTPHAGTRTATLPQQRGPPRCPCRPLVLASKRATATPLGSICSPVVYIMPSENATIPPLSSLRCAAVYMVPAACSLAATFWPRPESICVR